MHDYYRMVAIFNPLTRPTNGRQQLDYPIGTRAEVERLVEEIKQSVGLLRRHL